jgi:nitrogen regulatory protein P-II 1
MLKIEAVVRSTRFHNVQHALADVGIETFSAYDIKLTGLHKGHTTGGRPGSFKASDLIAKTNVVVLCHERDKEKITKAIIDASKTGQKGDGLISVYKIENLTKIRNGSTEEAALR